MNRGLSLIELMVVISIIAVISIVAIPNLRNFSKTEDVKNVAKDVVNTLRTVRSNSVSNIKCPNANSSEYWKARINKDDYSLIVICNGGIVTPIKTYPYAAKDSVGTSVVIEVSSDKCGAGSIDVIYTANDYYFICTSGVGTPQRSDLVVTLKDKSNPTGNFVNIKINGAGVVNDI